MRNYETNSVAFIAWNFNCKLCLSLLKKTVHWHRHLHNYNDLKSIIVIIIVCPVASLSTSISIQKPYCPSDQLTMTQCTVSCVRISWWNSKTACQQPSIYNVDHTKRIFAVVDEAQRKMARWLSIRRLLPWVFDTLSVNHRWNMALHPRKRNRQNLQQDWCL